MNNNNDDNKIIIMSNHFSRLLLFTIGINMIRYYFKRRKYELMK
jgi:hypothetical protein